MSSGQDVASAHFTGVAAAVFIALVMASGAQAQDAAFQSFFSSACQSPTGSLATRCAETPGGAGGLSADSQNSLNPGQSLGANDTGLARAQALTDEIQERQEARRAEDSGAPRFGAFLQVRGDDFDRKRSGRERGYDGDSLGGILGLDYRVSSDAFVGVLFSWDASESEFDRDDLGVGFTPPSNDGMTESDSFGINVYGSYNLSDQIYLDGSLGWTRAEYDLERNAVFQETTRMVPQTGLSVSADPDGDQFTASAGAGYDIQREAFSGGPYVRFNYARSEVDGYRESNGSGLEMRIDDATRTSFTSVLGVRGAYVISTGFGVVVPQLRLEYEHEFRSDRSATTARFIQDSNATSFRVRGNRPDGDRFNAGIGATIQLENGWMPYVDYEILFGDSRLDRQQFLVGVRKEF